MAKKKRSDRSGEAEGNDETSRWKYLAFTALFTFPALMYFFEAISNISKSFRLPTYVYVVLTAVIVVVIWMYFRTGLRGFHKYIALILLPILLFPSLQVYMCSPVVLANKDIGTRFKLSTTAEEILQDCGEHCLKQFSKSFYSLSLITPRVTLQVMAGEVVDLNVTTNSLAASGDTLKTSRLYLIFSLRSVRGKVHSLSILTKVPFRSTKVLEALQRKQSMELTGKVVNIGADLKEMKANLERNKLFVRPVVFEPYRIVVNNDDEL